LNLDHLESVGWRKYFRDSTAAEVNKTTDIPIGNALFAKCHIGANVIKSAIWKKGAGGSQPGGAQ
jgi:hypothetical protein